MTLVTRIIRDCDVIIGVDNQINGDNGLPLMNRDTGKKIDDQKLLVFENQKFAVGISGFINQDDFSVIDYLKALSSKPESINIDILRSQLKSDLSSRDNPVDHSVMLISGSLNGCIENVIFRKSKKNGVEWLKRSGLIDGFHRIHAHILCKHLALDFTEVQDKYENIKADLYSMVDFNFNYLVEEQDYDVLPSIPYTYFFIFYRYKYETFDLKVLNGLSNKSLVDFLVKFFAFLGKMNGTVLPKRNRMLNTIGECGGICKITTDSVSWLYDYEK